MMLVSSAVFSAVLAGLEALLEDEDLEDEDEQRNQWRKYGQKRIMKNGQLVVSMCSSIVNSLEQRNKMKMNNGTLLVQRKMEVGKDWTEEEFEDEDEDEDITKDIIDFKLSVDQPKIIRQPKALLEDEDEDEDGQRNRVKMSSEMKKMKKQTELLLVNATLEQAALKELGGPAMEKLLQRLQDSAHTAEDLIDELDYFRIHDELHDTYDAADQHGKGCIKPVVGDEEDIISNFTKVYWDFDSARRQLQLHQSVLGLCARTIKPVVGDEEDVISNFTKVYWDFDSARRQLEDQSMNACFASEPSITRNIKDIIDFKLSVDQPKIIRKQGTDMDIFWCIVDALAQECNHGKFSDVRRRHEDQFFALIGDTVSAANGQSISYNTGPMYNIAAMKSLGTECVNFSVTDSSLQNRAHRISSADASGRLRPEVDTGFCSPLWVLDSGGAPPPWIYDTGASFTLTEDLCIPLPPRHRPRGFAQHNLHRPRGLAQHNLHCPRPRALAQHNLQRPRPRALAQHNLQRPRPRALAQHNLHRPRALAQHNLHRPRGLAQHNLHRPRGLAQHNLHRHRPRGLAQLLRVLSPVWIYDTGASFSLTGDLSLLPGVCSTSDCSPFLGLRHADPVSAANGQSVVSNKCGRASGTLNLSRTAPQTTGLISSSEPIAADNSRLLTPDTTPEQTWRVASAAPQHMTGYLNHLIDYTPASGDQVIDTPNMGPLAVHGRGSVNTANITLQDVLYVPCLDANLVSTGQLAQLGYMITLGPYGCRIYKDDEDMPLVGEAHYVDGYLLELDFLRVRPSTN